MVSCERRTLEGAAPACTGLGLGDQTFEVNEQAKSGTLMHHMM